MKQSVVPDTKRAPFIETWADAAVDALSCLLLSVGMILAFDQLFRFRATVPEMMLHAVLVTGVLVLLRRRLWILPAVSAAVVFLWLSVQYALGRGEDTLQYISGFLRWWLDLFPKFSPYSTERNYVIVQWCVHIVITGVVYFLVRQVRAVMVMAIGGAIVFAAIMVSGFRENIAPIALMLMGLLPLMTRNGFFCLRPVQATGLTARWKAQLSAAAICAVCALLAMLLLPASTAGWKLPPLVRMGTNLGGILSGKPPVTDFAPVTLQSIGLQPNADRLGGPLSQDDRSPVMRVVTDHPFLMKGSVYTEYTGSGWTAHWDTVSGSGYALGSELTESEYNRAFSIGKPNGSRGQRILRERETPASVQVTLYKPFATLFAFGRVRSVQVYTPPGQELLFNARSELFFDKTPTGQLSYSFDTRELARGSAIASRALYELEEAGAESGDVDYASIRDQYTQLPASLPAAVYEKAATIVKGQKTPYQQMERLESYLRTNYRYTLTPAEVPPERDFVDYFLETGEGYCVYFASAMAVMARTQGIPARFVVGFGLEAEGADWVARQSTAHAWVECYFSGVGWVTFDPTAGSSYRQPAPGPGMSTGTSAGQTRDSEPIFVPQTTASLPDGTTSTLPDPATTTGLTAAAPGTTTTTAAEPPDGRHFPAWLLWLLIGALALTLLILLLVWRILSVRRAYRLEDVRARFASTVEQMEWYYRDLLRLLAWMGYEPQRGETLLCFVRRSMAGLEREEQERAAKCAKKGKAPAFLPELPALTEACRWVMNWRYGEQPPQEGEVAAIAVAHERLEEAACRRLGRLRVYIRRILGL